MPKRLMSFAQTLTLAAAPNIARKNIMEFPLGDKLKLQLITAV